MISFPNRKSAIVVLLVAACAPAAAPRPSPGAPEARWLAVDLAGQRAGRTHEVVAALADGGFATRVTSELGVGRLGTVVEMASDVTFDEDARGVLRAARVRMTLSRQTTTTDVAFAAGAATIRESAGGRDHVRTVAVAEPLLGPEAIRRASAARLRRPGDTLAYRTWSVFLAAPQQVRCTAEADETLTIDGAPTRLLRITVVAEGEGQTRTAWLDAGGREARSELSLPFGLMVATQARTEPARRTGELPADAFARTLLRSNVRLPGARSLDRLVVRLELDAAQLPALDSGDARIVRRDAGGAVIEIDRVAVPASGAPGSVGPEFLGASAIIDPTDPQVRAIAGEVIAGATDPWDRAQRLTRWVTDHMTFDAGVAFAPAAELARDRHGTCAGYAVLLASLLRAADIPARLDMGLVYVAGVFAGHAWVEAHLRGRWVPLDAALPGDGPADAARIAIGRDALDAGPGALVSAFGAVVGRARIRVLGYTSAGRPAVQVDAAAPYIVDGSRYTNAGLGLSITAPAGYRFTDMDAVWPERAFLALQGDGGRVTFAETTAPAARDPAQAEAQALELVSAAACAPRAIAGRRGCAVRRDGGVAVAFVAGPSLFTVEARGPRPEALLDAVAGTLRLDDAIRGR